MGIKMGEWIAVTENGVRFSAFDDRYSFPSKKDVIKDIGDAKLDARRKPKVRRVAPGEYMYTPKSCDTGHDGATFWIIRLTKENIDRFKKLIEDQEKEEEEE